jgi:hypothetical protein
MRLTLIDRLANFRNVGLRCACLAVAALACAVDAPRASAEFFQYATQLTTFAAPSYPNPPGVPVTISISPFSSDVNAENYDATAPGTDIVYASISVAHLNNAFAGSGPISIPYVFQITVSDYATFAPPGGPSPDNAVFTISGTLTGSIGPGKKVNLTTDPTITPSSPTLIGDENYLLTFNPFVPPGPAFDGAFGLHILARHGTIPEPGTLTLLGLGSLALATPAWRRWRRKSPVSG